MPPIKCTPCRVRVGETRYRVCSDGHVFSTEWDGISYVDQGDALPESAAKLVRREAARLRRNRNAREVASAKRDLGLKQTPHGWE